MDSRAWALIAFIAAACEKDEQHRSIEVEVVAAQVLLAGKDVSVRIDDAMMEKVRRHPDVASVFPRLLLRNPDIKETNLFAIVVDGIPASAVANDPELAAHFVEGATPVPMIVSTQGLELYNGRIAEAHGTPKLSELELWVAKRNKLSVPIAVSDGRRLEAVAVGISPRAASIGVTLPIGDVARWNREVAGDAAATSYESLHVTLRDESKLRSFDAWLDKTLGLKRRRSDTPVAEKSK